MKLSTVFTLMIFLGMSFSSLSFADQSNKLVAETSIDNEWVVNIITENSVHASVNGQVTHGDGLHVRLVKNHCDRGNLLTFVYTYSNHPKIDQLKGSYITTKFMGGEVIVRILFASPFLMGHRATIDLGWASIGELKRILKEKNPIVLQYLDSKEVKITDYFDITHNNWSNHGVSETLERAQEVCKKL